MTTLLLYSNTLHNNLLNATTCSVGCPEPIRIGSYAAFSLSVSGLTKAAFPQSKLGPVRTLAKRLIDVTHIVGSRFEKKVHCVNAVLNLHNDLSRALYQLHSETSN